MRHRNWTFYKGVLYMGLAGAIALLALICYILFFRFSQQWQSIRVLLILLGNIFQLVFYILCIRLIHFYVPNRLQPGISFSKGFLVLLVCNSFLAVGFLYLLAYGFSQTFFGKNNKPSQEDYFALFILGIYTFTTIYLSAASVVLLRYNRYQASLEEEEWLHHLGES